MRSLNLKFGIVVAVGKSMDHNSQPSKMVAMETKNIIKLILKQMIGIVCYKIDAK